MAKIEAGKMEVYVEQFDVAEVARAVESIAKPLMKKNQNTLEIDVPEGAGKMESDVTKLRQMLFNLISNAAKFTEEGTIRLEVTRSNRERAEWLTFAVSDTGIGMTPEQLELVFEEFSQAETTTTRDYGGTGLGLPITRRFCELLGGNIRAASEVGKGSRFEIDLPAKTDVAQAPVSPTVQPVVHPRGGGELDTSSVIGPRSPSCLP
jgi:signal transduction histidine kinase